MSDKNKIRKKFVVEGLIAFFIAITPILAYFYKYIPFTSNDSWELLWINFSSNGYSDISTAFYYYTSKLVPLSLLIIWFTTCKQWWYHSILIPIAMYSFQLYGVLSEDTKRIDENEILYLLVVCMVVIPFVYFIRIKLYDKYVHGIDLEAMDAELRAYKEKEKNKNVPKSFVNDKAGDQPKDNNENAAPYNKLDHFISNFQGRLEKLFDFKF